jgi:hypothetical protein
MPVSKKPRKLGFYEIGRGKFGRQVQSYFEQAQIIANERNVPVCVRAAIRVFPIKEDNVGYVETAAQIVEPPIKSIKYNAEYDHGAIISTGDSIGEILQGELEFPDLTGDDKNLSFTQSQEQ